MTALVASVLGGWVLTYLVHATLLLLLALLLLRRRPDRPGAETLWRAALYGGLLTATLQTLLGGGVLARVTLAPQTAPAPAAAVGAEAQPAPATVPVASAAPAATGADAAAIAAALDGLEARLGGAPDAAAPAATARPVAVALGGAWLLGVLLVLARHGRGRRRLRASLAGRAPVEDAALRAALDRVLAGTRLAGRVRLSAAPHLGSPVALGLRRPEICLPARAMRALGVEQVEAMLAHEAAHLLRRDPLWLLAGRLMTTVLFFQPLNHVAVRRLRDLAELSCDAWAVRRTGGPTALATCLAEVAGWVVAMPQTLPAASMAHPGPLLARRVERLLEPAAKRARTRPWSGRLGAAVMLALLVWLGPTVGPARAAVPAGPVPTAHEAEARDVAAELARLAPALDALEAEVREVLDLMARVDGGPALDSAAVALTERLLALRTRHEALRRAAGRVLPPPPPMAAFVRKETSR